MQQCPSGLSTDGIPHRHHSPSAQGAKAEVKPDPPPSARGEAGPGRGQQRGGTAAGPAGVCARLQGHLGGLSPAAPLLGPAGEDGAAEPPAAPPAPQRPRPGPQGGTGPDRALPAGHGRAAKPAERRRAQPRDAHRAAAAAPPQALLLRRALPALTQLDGGVRQTTIPLPAQLALRRHLDRPLPPQAAPLPPPPHSNSRETLRCGLEAAKEISRDFTRPVVKVTGGKARCRLCSSRPFLPTVPGPKRAALPRSARLRSSGPSWAPSFHPGLLLCPCEASDPSGSILISSQAFTRAYLTELLPSGLPPLVR